jgi:hypothetical protein
VVGGGALSGANFLRAGLASWPRARQYSRMTTDDTPTEATADFPGHKLAVWLGTGLLTGLVLVLVMVLRDNAHRTALEHIIIPFSAASDTSYLPMPTEPPAPPYPAVATLDGQPLYPVNYRHREKSEVDLVRVGRDEALGINIYQQSSRSRNDDEKDTAQSYYLKLGPGIFLKAQHGAGQ